MVRLHFSGSDVSIVLLVRSARPATARPCTVAPRATAVKGYSGCVFARPFAAAVQRGSDHVEPQRPQRQDPRLGQVGGFIDTQAHHGEVGGCAAHEEGRCEIGRRRCVQLLHQEGRGPASAIRVGSLIALAAYLKAFILLDVFFGPM